MRKIISFMHISLGGFVADPNGVFSVPCIAGCSLSPAGGGSTTV
jgi:hypothetical protein